MTSQVSDPDLLISLTFEVINIPQPSLGEAEAVSPKLSVSWSVPCALLPYFLLVVSVPP